MLEAPKPNAMLEYSSVEVLLVCSWLKLQSIFLEKKKIPGSSVRQDLGMENEMQG